MRDDASSESSMLLVYGAERCYPANPEAFLLRMVALRLEKKCKATDSERGPEAVCVVV